MIVILTVLWLVVGSYYDWRNSKDYIDLCNSDFREIDKDFIGSPFYVVVVTIFFGACLLIVDCLKHGFKILNHNKYYLDGEKK